MGTDGAPGPRSWADDRATRGTPARKLAGRLRAWPLARLLALAVCLTIGVAAAASASPGVLDPSFGTGGVATVDFGGQDTGWAEAIQPDGRIVIVGETSAGAAGGFDVAVARLTAAGALDPSFGSGGLVKLDFGNTDEGTAVALQPDGRIVVAGQTFAPSGDSEFAVARLNADGSLDPSFGTSGEARFEFPGGTSALATAVLVTPDGHVLVTGRTAATPGADDFAALRLNADGSLDPSFGTGGETTVDFGGDDIPAAATLTGDGQLVIAGETTGADGGDFAVARLNPDGALDSTFGAGGRATINFGAADDAGGVAVQPDGKLLVGGQTSGGNGDLAVARLNVDGSLDPTFGTGGKATVDFGGHDAGAELALQGDGAVILAGAATVGTSQRFAVARLTAAGVLDPGFGTGGKTTVALDGGDNIAFAHAVALQPDGSIVAAGVSGSFDFAVARLLGGAATGGTAGGGGSTLPPAPHCGRKVPAYAKGRWRCVTAGAPINDGLTLIASEVPGLRGAGHGTKVARAALGSALPGKRLGRAAAAAAFRAGSRHLSTATFPLRTAGAARKAMGATARGYRKLARVGDQAKLKVSGATTRGSGRAKKRRSPVVAVVVLRVGRAVAVVRLTVPAAGTTVTAARLRRYVGTLAGDYATTLAQRLTRVLALTPWQRNLDLISPTGAVTKAVALRAFALQYRSLPGARRPKGATGAPASGTLAIEMVVRVWSQLSAAQRSGVQADLGLRSGSVSSVRAHSADAQPVKPDPVNQAVVQHWVQAYAAKLPGHPTFAVKVLRSAEPLDGDPDTLADATPVDSHGNTGTSAPMAYCQIRVAPSLMSTSAQYRILSLAHETFHCDEYALDRSWANVPDWIMEGMAEWASQAIDPVPADVGDEWFLGYLETSDSPLFARTYDADGFWGYAEEVGGRGSLWSKVPAILSAGNSSSAAAYVTAGGTNPAFLQTWASATLRYAPGGKPWNQTDPYSLSWTQAKPLLEPVGPSGGLVSAPYAVGLFKLQPDPESPLINVIPLAGTVRGADGPQGGDLGVISSSDWFCAGGDCECPPGTTGTVPKARDIGGDLLLALTGGGDIGQARVTSHSLDEYCQDEDEGGGAGSGAGHGNGIAVYTIGETSLKFLGDIDHGSCRVSGGAFVADASGGGYTMHVHVAGATKPNVLYTISSGSSSRYITVNGYSSQGTPKTGLGGLKFRRVTIGRKRRLRVSLGFDALFKGTGELILAPEKGGLVC